jgi:hypothetical protein
LNVPCKTKDEYSMHLIVLSKTTDEMKGRKNYYE